MPISADDHRRTYLQHRAILHETLCRIAATYLCNPRLSCALLPCRLRKCRRDRVCRGAMLPSERLQERIWMLQKVGLSSAAGITLPACMIAADDEIFSAFETCKNDWANKLAESPGFKWANFVRGLKEWLREKNPSEAALPMEDADNL